MFRRRARWRELLAPVYGAAACAVLSCAAAPEPLPPEPLLEDRRPPPKQWVLECISRVLETVRSPPQPTLEQQQAVFDMDLQAFWWFHGIASQRRNASPEEKDRAYAHIRRCLEIAPGHGPCVSVLAAMQKSDGDLAHAAESYRLAIRIDPDPYYSESPCKYLAEIKDMLAGGIAHDHGIALRRQLPPYPEPARPPTPMWVHECVARWGDRARWTAFVLLPDMEQLKLREQLGLDESARARALWTDLKRSGKTTAPAHIIVQRCLRIYPSSLPCLKLLADMQYHDGSLVDAAATLRELIRNAPSYEFSQPACQLLLEIEPKLAPNSIPAPATHPAEPDASTAVHSEGIAGPTE